MADEKKAVTPDEDKSINDLLDEYAGDVKDKDLDDFLKSDDEEEDAFEGDESDDEDNDKALADEVQPKKSGGFMSMLLIIIAFGAAGAGAYIYLNKDQGMTAIMGGFMGQDEPTAQAVLDTPPTPDAAPVMMPATKPHRLLKPHRSHRHRAPICSRCRPLTPVARLRASRPRLHLLPNWAHRPPKLNPLQPRLINGWLVATPA